MSNLFRPIHALVRRYWAALERLSTALGLAGLLLYLMRSLPAYPPYWDGVLAGAVFGATLGSPALGYFLALAAAVYPVSQVSIYLMALFLAVALLGQRIFINNLGGLLLVLAAPLLSAVYLPWLAPLLGGLFWGPLGGLLIGGVAALWGQLLFAMTGAPPDGLINLGLYPNTPLVVERFTGLDSFDTLWLLAGPFFPDPTTLLYLLLQAAAWAGVGWLVGALAEKPWAQVRRPAAGILLALAGALALLGLQAGAALWLGAYTLAELSAMGRPLGLALAGAALAAALLEVLHGWMEYPMAARARKPRLFTRPLQPAVQPGQPGVQPGHPGVQPGHPGVQPGQPVVRTWLRGLFRRTRPARIQDAAAAPGSAQRHPAARVLPPGAAAYPAARDHTADEGGDPDDSDNRDDPDNQDDDLVMLEID